MQEERPQSAAPAACPFPARCIITRTCARPHTFNSEGKFNVEYDRPRTSKSLLAFLKVPGQQQRVL